MKYIGCQELVLEKHQYDEPSVTEAGSNMYRGNFKKFIKVSCNQVKQMQLIYVR